MSPNRFEYSEICPTCKAAGIVGEDEKPISLGFDIDTSTICCVMGHEFETLPSEASVVASQGDKSQESATGSLRPDATLGADIGSSGESAAVASDVTVCHNLGTDSAETEAANAQADSAALAQLSKQMEKPVVEVPIPVTEPQRDAVVADGARLSNGDLAVCITVPEQWADAVRAEAEIQNKTVSDYLSEQVGQYLADYWTSNYTQAR